MRGIKAVFLVVLAICVFSGGTARAEGEIAVILKTLNSNFWQKVIDGISHHQERLEESGRTFVVTYDGPDSENDIQNQVDMVDAAVKRGVKAIVLAPNDPDALIPPLRRASAAGIPVLLLDSKVNDETLFLSLITGDDRSIGKFAASMLIDRVGGPETTGEIAILSYVDGAESEMKRVGGFREHIETNSGLTIVSISYSNSNMLTAMRQTAEVLTAHPGLVGIFAADQATAVGMCRTFRERRIRNGMRDEIVTVGYDGYQTLLDDFCREGTLGVLVQQISFMMGTASVAYAVDAVDGKPLDRRMNTALIASNGKNLDEEDEDKEEDGDL